MFYEQNTPSRKLIADLMETCFLMNVVHNNYHEPDAIFAPFFAAGEEFAKNEPNGLSSDLGLAEQKATVNGTTQVLT